MARVYDILLDAAGLGDRLSLVTLDLRPAGGMSGCMLMPGSALCAATIRADENSGRARHARFVVDRVVSRLPPLAFPSCRAVMCQVDM